MTRRKYIFVLISYAYFCLNAYAQEEDQAEDLAQQAANPIADLMSFPFQNNLNMNYGEFNRNTNVLNIQPVIPLFNGKLITRTIFPIVSIPDYASSEGTLTSGLADIVFTPFYVPKTKGIMVGFGPVFEFPSGGAERGSEKWSLGPSAVALLQPEDWTLGILANNVWSYAGNSDRADVNRMLINLFVVRQLGDGWYLNSAPIITANWKAEPDQRWIVPLGLGGGKMMFIGGKLPLNVQSQLYYNVVRPDFGPEWQWRFQAQILLPKF